MTEVVDSAWAYLEEEYHTHNDNNTLGSVNTPTFSAFETERGMDFQKTIRIYSSTRASTKQENYPEKYL